ncbi:MAG: glycosyltransferase [Cytophagaceae bacterium]
MKKNKVLFLALHRPDRSPSQRFRFEQYIDFLNQHEFVCKQIFLLNQHDDKIYYSKGKFLTKIIILIKSIFKLLKKILFSKYEIVFIQREGFMLGTSIFERLFSYRSKIIFDFDDSIWRQQTGENKSNNKRLQFLKNPDKTKDLISLSHMIFAGNEYLANFALQYNSNVKIIPTTIDTDKYRITIKQKKERVCIGWSGSFSTIIHFEFIVEYLEKLINKYGSLIYFKVIGDENYVNPKLNLKGSRWNHETEVKDLSEIDIGIMPLPDDEWTKGKCGLKGLQYMALGIPTIMSPVGVNTTIIQDGINGFLAYSPDDWISKLSILIENEHMRNEMGNKGRETVETYYSVNSNKDLYLKYFRELLKSN